MSLGWISTIIVTWRHSKTHLQVSFGWIFMLKKAAITHCVHSSHSVPLHLSLIITLNNITSPLLQPFHSPGEGFIWSIFIQPLLGEFWSSDHSKTHNIHPMTHMCLFMRLVWPSTRLFAFYSCWFGVLHKCLTLTQATVKEANSNSGYFSVL
jgi:hypothetical protein